MVLVDTSVWVAHLRGGKIGLDVLLHDGHVRCHTCVIGELACGNLKNRNEILTLLRALPMATHATHEEVMHFLDSYRLMGKGLGYIDVNLLASAFLSEIPLWTLDKKLHNESLLLGSAY